MATNKLAIAAAILACSTLGHAAGQSESERARQILLKTLERTFSQNVLAIISQRSPDSTSMQRIQVQISKDGKSRKTVIYPLSMEGVEMIDDGTQSATYLPDEKLMLIQESPMKLPNDSQSRINLTVRNYGLKIGGSTTVAGQTATIVVASPRSKDLETRRYYVDERSGFILQLETIGSDGQPRVAFKAQTLVYPPRFSSNTFVIDTDSKDGRKVVYKRKTNWMDTTPRSAALGFEPVFPEDLPYGFEVQDAQVNDSDDWKSVAVRITDGLVKGTVYQWQASAKVRIKTMVATSMGDANGIRFAVTADVPEAVRQKILKTFINAARESNASAGLCPDQELGNSAATLFQADVLIQGFLRLDLSALLLAVPSP